MGRTLSHLKLPLYPLYGVSEHCVTIPANETLSVPDADLFRILFFLGDTVQAEGPAGKLFSIAKGDVLTVGEGIEVRYRGKDPDREVLSHILKIVLQRSENPSAEEAEFWKIIGDAAGEIRHFPEQVKRLGSLDLLKQVRTELERGEEISAWRMSGLCLALIAPLIDSNPERAVEQVQPAIHRGEAAVEHARQYMQEYAHHDLDLGRIAWQVQLSGEHLSRLFRKYLGITVMAYLRQVRMENVMRYLLSTDLPVVEICRKSGFSTQSLLCRHFKEKTGMTPLAYRMQARKREKFSPSQLQTDHETAPPSQARKEQ